MADKHEAQDTYIIPPNFIETGTIFGGMFKLRNAIEAGVLAVAAGLPFLRLQASLTTKIILLCLTALPLGLIALIGVSGESLSSFILNFFRFVKNRRIIKGCGPPAAAPGKKKKQPKDEVDALKQQLREAKRKQKLPQPAAQSKKKRKATTADYLNIEKIENGVVYTRDHRFVKIIEVVPINFLLRSAREQRNIIYAFISFLKISPVKMQLKVLTKRADIGRHIQHVRDDMARESDERCRALQQDYEQLLRRIGSKEAVTRRFFIIFEYEPIGRRDNNPIEAVSALQGAVNTTKTFLLQCGNEILTSDNEDEFTADVLYNILNRRSSADKPLAERAAEVMARYVEQGREAELDSIPATEFFAPDQLNFKHGRHIYMDGVYHSYLLIPSGGFKHKVSAGWLSLLVNAGDGIDVDIFLHKQPKDRVMQRLGQQLRINRSKIKDASDTNTDFDDIEGAIRSGYFLKEGLADNEDFYYMNILITITAESAEELEWRTSEMKKLMISQDLDVVVCTFRQEQAFNSALPLISLERSCSSAASVTCSPWARQAATPSPASRCATTTASCWASTNTTTA
jgi:hypothetical protein